MEGISLAWTTERSDLRITTSHAPTPSCQSNACPNDEVPASAPAMLPGASFHGGIMNTRWSWDMAQSCTSTISMLCSGSVTTFCTAPPAEILATLSPMAGGWARPHVYRAPSLGSFLAWAENPMGRSGPNTQGPLVSSVLGSTSMGQPPSHSTSSLPAWNSGEVLAGLVGKLARLAKMELAWVHAPRTAMPALSPPAFSCFTTRSVRTMRAPARALLVAPSSSTAEMKPSPSNQCA
mmetsp:Transcript_20588/g.51281  ORF Transcript_20588/g.51281 Transcript_20588/m.51281 type:complete len:236 (+) Transcript_20588:99-806(+)